MKTNAKKIEKMEQKEEDQRKKPNGFEKSERKNQKPKKADKEEDKEDEEDNEDDIDLLSNNDVEEVQKILIETLGNTNLTVINEAISYLDDFPLEVIKEALVRTARKQKTWDYAKGTLNKWLQSGLDTLQKIQANDIDFKNKNKPKEETDEERIARLTREMEERLKNESQ